LMGKTLILKPLLRSPNSISFMLIIFTFQLIQTIRILWFCHRSVYLIENGLVSQEPCIQVNSAESVDMSNNSMIDELLQER
jgi:hypothetical protein